jgi:hypothetical protein
MDEYTVQTYVANWLTAAGVQSLDKVWPGRPNETGPNWNEFGSGTGRCQAIVEVSSSTDVRRSGPASNPWVQGWQPGKGIREETFPVTIELWHCWQDNTKEGWLAGELDFKQNVVGGIRAAIKYDPTLGTGHGQSQQPLFHSAGEGRSGIRVMYGDAVQSDMGREQIAHVLFSVCAFEVG